MAWTPEFVTSDATTKNLLTVVIKITVPDLESLDLDEVPDHEIDERLECLRKDQLTKLQNRVALFEKSLMLSGDAAAIMIEPVEDDDENRVFYLFITTKKPKQLSNRRAVLEPMLDKFEIQRDWIRPLTGHLLRSLGHGTVSKEEFQEACAGVTFLSQVATLKKLCPALKALDDQELFDMTKTAKASKAFNDEGLFDMTKGDEKEQGAKAEGNLVTQALYGVEIPALEDCSRGFDKRCSEVATRALVNDIKGRLDEEAKKLAKSWFLEVAGGCLPKFHAIQPSHVADEHKLEMLKEELMSSRGVDEPVKLAAGDLPEVAALYLKVLGEDQRVGYAKNKIIQLFTKIANDEGIKWAAERDVPPNIREPFLAKFGEIFSLCHECGAKYVDSPCKPYCSMEHKARACKTFCEDCGPADLKQIRFNFRWWSACAKCGKVLHVGEEKESAFECRLKIAKPSDYRDPAWRSRRRA